MSGIAFYGFLAFGVILGVAADLCRRAGYYRRKAVKQYRFGEITDAENRL